MNEGACLAVGALYRKRFFFLGKAVMSVTAGQHPRCLLLVHLHTFTRVTSTDRAVFLTAALIPCVKNTGEGCEGL